MSNKKVNLQQWLVGVVGLSRIVNTDKVAGSSPALVISFFLNFLNFLHMTSIHILTSFNSLYVFIVF